MKRRAFIQSVERIAAGLLCAGMSGLAVGCSGLGYVPSTRVGNRLIIRQADVGDGAHTLVEDPQLARAVYLHRFDDGTFSAVLTRCTHQGCQVEPAGDRLACPCHGSEYRVTGEVLRGPAERSLQRYRVTTDPEYIYIHL